MAFVPRTYSGKPFRLLTGIRPLNQSMLVGQIRTGNKITNGLLVEGQAGIQPETASFLVANNDFSTGRVVVVLGEYNLISGVDFAIGATVILTAANIATAITNLTGFTAINDGTDTVSIWFDIGTAHVIDFRINQYGTVENLTTLDPDDNYMELGSPTPGPVDIKPAT